MFFKHLTMRGRVRRGQIVVIAEAVGFCFELASAHPDGQFFVRKNEAILLGLPELVQCLLEVTDAGGGFERVLFRCGTFLLKLF
jgi:hypothetical protein